MLATFDAMTNLILISDALLLENHILQLQIDNCIHCEVNICKCQNLPRMPTKIALVKLIHLIFDHTFQKSWSPRRCFS